MRGRTAVLLTTVFLSGAAVMSIEMTAVRLIQPFFGSTTWVWTNVIAIVLGALSVGYAIGGRIADRRPSHALLYGVVAVGGVLALAIAPAATPLCRWLLPTDLHIDGISRVLERGAVIATLILFAPPILFLGLVSPLAIRLLAEGGVGRAAGRVFAIGTVGSIVGTYLPTVWLVPELGSRRSIQVAAAMLLVPAAIGLATTLRSWARPAAVLLLVSLGLPAAALATRLPERGPPARLPVEDEDAFATVLAEGESEYQYLTVREDIEPKEGRRLRILTINEGVFTYHSLEVVGSVLTQARYYDDYSLLPLFLDVPRGEELRGAVVGLACGTTARQWRHFWEGPYRLRVDGAEIDPLVVAWGREFFHLPDEDEEWLNAYVMDGRQMLEALPPERKYHMLVVDAFTNELYIPFHLGTREFFELCKSRMEPGGVLAMNVFAYRVDSENLLALSNTLASVFGHAVHVKQSWTQNFVLMARNGDAPPDVTRMAGARIAARFGERADTDEWPDLLLLAARIPTISTVIHPRDDLPILTDDFAPLERMMDREIERYERRYMGE